MKKILLTENQLEMIRKTIIEGSDSNYESEVEVKVYIYRVSTYKGKEISDVRPYQNIKLSFVIDMEVRSWGVKSVSLYGIRGPESIKMTVDYYINEEGDYESEDIDVKLDWDKLETDDKSGQGIITIGNELEIELMNDENGNLVLRDMSIETYNL